MRIRGSRGRWALPPDVESSTLQPLPPPQHSQLRLQQPWLQPSYNSISLEQVALIDMGEDEDTAKGKNVATTPRRYECNTNSEIAADTDSSISSSSSHVGLWLEEDKALPLKKRRLVHVLDMKGGKEPNDKSTERELKNSNETSAKRKRTEKIWTDYVLQLDSVTENACHKAGNMNNNERCNRKNGKGWRCSLPAVAGHSLCEHHLTHQQKKNSRKK